MVFSSLVFLFIFLPITILVYYLLPFRFKNQFLLFVSLLFFAWAGVTYSLLMIFSIIINFFLGTKMSSPGKKKYLIIGLVYNFGMLIGFKYTGFIVSNLNQILGILHVNKLPAVNIVLPIGISFYTFQAVSYLIDVYYGKTEIQKRISHLGLYIALFPQLIAGPIVRYHEIKEQLINRKHSISQFSEGVQRFIIGLGKKVLLANTLAVVVDQVFSSPVSTYDTFTAWVTIFFYALQIFFDFSGYSDMAIGLGKMFGFKIPENFNFPYISTSIKEFWRRWHITLSSWFRDYLYIPIGGNRKGKYRTYLNLLVVFVVTGFWHGASWNFLIWGLIHGMFLLLERSKIKFPKGGLSNILGHFYTLLVVLVAWVFFRSDNLQYAKDYCWLMFGIRNVGDSIIMGYVTNKNVMVIIVSVLASTPVFVFLRDSLAKLSFISQTNWYKLLVNLLEYVKIVFLLTILVLCITFLSAGTYNPFIYFRF